MADEKYNLVFRGELVPGADLAQVKQNLARLFKMDAARIDILFSGKTVVLKRGLDTDTAAKYRMAINKAGARIDTVASDATPVKPPAQNQEAEATSKASASPGSDRPQAHQGPTRVSATPETSALAAPQAPSQAADKGAVSLTLAPAGGDLLEPSEKRHIPAATVDTSNLSIRPAGASLLDNSERKQPAPVSVDLRGLDLAPVGADVLKPEERQAVPQVDLDLSQYAVAPPGDRLTPPPPAPPPPPDVSKLSLEQQS